MQFTQPIVVYIPPHCEIRGGAWVVIDSTINPKCMEMYAAEHARGGVLEPAGIAEIKFRKPELVKAMHRMDRQLKWMSMNEATGMVRPEDVVARETELLPSYQPLGEMFCDLHDRPGRMLAKGVIRDVVSWKRSREYFYWRVRRRLAQDALVKELKAGDDSLSHTDAVATVRGWVDGIDWEDDKAVLDGLTSDAAAIG